MNSPEFSWQRILACLLGQGLCASVLVAQAGPLEIFNFAGTGEPGYSGDGGPASEAQLNNPFGVARGPDGAIYICDTDNHVIRKVDRDGMITTVAGTGKRGYSGDGGPALEGALNEPYEIRFDAAGHLYFVEMRNHIVRRVDARTQTLSTVAGTGVEGFAGDEGLAIRALLKQPHSIQFGPDGGLYVCDIGNHRIRKIDAATGEITTFAGTGERDLPEDGGKFAGAPLHGPRAIDFDEAGNMWLALREGNSVFKLDLAAGVIHHAAGTGERGFSGNGGPAKAAALSSPKGISVGPDGKIYLADTESHSIRMLDLGTGKLELMAGTGERGDGPEGDALRCKLARPHGVFADRDGVVYVGDSEAHRVRVIRRVAQDLD